MTTTGLPLVIVGTWFGVLIGTLVVGNGLSGKPVSQLGQRPRGTGLLSWFWNSISTGVGIYGYDSSLGCWSPAVRVMIHLCIMGMISGFAMALLNGEDDLVVIISGVCAFYLGSLYWIHNVLPNVSHPGGPRQHKIQRIPKFPDSVSTAPSDGWRCAVAQDSHEVTTSLIPQGKMTGEPFGRQIWTTSAAASKSTSPPEKQGGFFGFGGTQKTVDEKLVQQLAAGGRSEGFNPSQNPNR